ncbi:E7 [Human papillomavirus type 190]|uniref:Protein E7 n=1 Tax=Human papillomavirus TaxID=10566 RepID=A0A385PK93_9PAPI|nr:E7 [Human papillomavirus type 190]AYA94467.1 MAG: E7 protein [Human papillomavirus]
MLGEKATIKDIVLELREISISSDLLFEEESLSSDAEEEQHLFKIETHCDNCKTGIRVCARSSDSAIRKLQYLLNRDLSFLCPGCSRNLFQHGRSH